jgi:hypothetical protein
MKLWTHLLHWFWLGVMLFAAGAGVMPQGDTAAADTGGPADTGGAGDAGSSGDAGQAAGQAPSGQDRNWAELRSKVSDLESKYKPWESLGAKPEEVSRWQGTHTKIYNEVANLGRNLGYADDEILEAIQLDPIKALDFLRQRTEEGQQDDQGAELRDLVAQHVEQAIGPIQQRENIRMTNEANALFERTVHGLAVDVFKKEGIDASQIPQDEMFMLTSAVSEVLKYDEGAIKELKFEGKTGGIQRAFQEARTMLDKYYVARSGRERGKFARPDQGNQGVQPQNGGKKPSLDEMINNPALINAKYS